MKLLLVVTLLSGLSIDAMAAVPDNIVLGSVVNGWRQGLIDPTENAMDLAISGDGFFVLKARKGEILYTRRASLRIDSEGNLIHDQTGYKILSTNEEGTPGPINLRGKGTKSFEGRSGQRATLISISITDKGVLSGTYSDGVRVDLAQLKLGLFENQRKLKLRDEKRHLLKAGKSAGDIFYGVPHSGGVGALYSRYRERIDSKYYSTNLD